MSQKNDLNLVSLHQRQEEISENEMKVVVAGTRCDPCVTDDVLVHINFAEQTAECSCGSIWVVFGLTWG